MAAPVGGLRYDRRRLDRDDAQAQRCGAYGVTRLVGDDDVERNIERRYRADMGPTD